MTYLLIAFFCFYLTPYHCFFIYANFVVIIIIVLKKFPCVYLIYTKVIMLSEHINSDNIRRQVIYIYICIAYFYIFAPYYCPVLFMLTFCFVVIKNLILYFRRVYLQKFIQHHNTSAATIAEDRYNIYRAIVYFIFCSVSVILFTLLSDNIYYRCFYLHLIFINKGYLNNL